MRRRVEKDTGGEDNSRLSQLDCVANAVKESMMLSQS